MNRQETARLLTIVWSLYPNAPKMTREDKEAMVMAWLALLYEYALNDVWEAVKECMEHEPRFVPTAPEVLTRCRKSYAVERYLPKEYAKLCATVDMTAAAEGTRVSLERMLRHAEASHGLADWEREQLEGIERERATIREIERMWNEAAETARIAYEQGERAKLAEDGATLKQLALV